jgi:exopolysaccharide production protein ExoY
MSLVGPLLMIPEQRQHYPDTAYFDAYFDMRPGLIGLGRSVSATDVHSPIARKHDTRYARIMSFGTDIRILLMTPAVIFQGTGL